MGLLGYIIEQTYSGLEADYAAGYSTVQPGSDHSQDVYASCSPRIQRLSISKPAFNRNNLIDFDSFQRGRLTGL